MKANENRIRNPFDSLKDFDFSKGASSGRRHQKVRHWHGPDPVSGATLCHLARRKANSPNLVTPLYAKELDGVTCLKCIKAIEISKKFM